MYVNRGVDAMGKSIGSASGKLDAGIPAATDISHKKQIVTAPDSSEMTVTNGCHVSQKVGPVKERSLLNSQECEHRSTFAGFFKIDN